ncbi:MAG: hypothetical protein U0822_08465 [Anaerolineae bacterium]
MTEYTLTVIDTAGIQDYIFGSNNLKQNVGASALAHWATHTYVYETLNELGKSNFNRADDVNLARIERIEDGLVSELIYAGGGNTVIVFRNTPLFDGETPAHEFTRRLTRKILTDAAGLQLVIAHAEFDWQTTQLGALVAETLRKLADKKMHRPPDAPLLGLSVTADCQYTGLPATMELPDPDNRLRRVSAEVQQKNTAYEWADKRLRELIEKEGVDLSGYAFIRDFDDLGEKGEASYIAVVHTDGNRMGKRVEALASRHPDSREYMTEMRKFSESIDLAARSALAATVRLLKESIVEGNIGGVVTIRPDKDADKGKLPFRPIVFGGDDVTFVTDGRLGLPLTAFYLEQLKLHPLSDGAGPIVARAGIAVVKSHYPFARAYDLAENLQRSAKSMTEEGTLAALDWHFATSGAVLPLKEIRERQYTGDDGPLTMRPLAFRDATPAQWRTWSVFKAMIARFNEKEWAERHNKIKGVQTVLRDGSHAAEQFRTLYGLPLLPDIIGNPAAATTGWIGDRCTCYDPIEALEFFVPLEEAAHANV